MKILKILGIICLVLIGMPFLVLWWKGDISDLTLFLIIFIGGVVVIFSLAFVATIYSSFKRK